MVDTNHTADRDADRRRDGWTWTKEILGTAVAVVSVMALPSAWLFTTLNGLMQTQAIHSLEIAHMKEVRITSDARIAGQDAKLDKILEQITEIKVQAAMKSGKP